MSWLYSRALVAAYSEATCSDGAQSALLSGNPTPQAYLSLDKMTAFSRRSLSGMTFKPLTENLGADLLTWFLADSRVRTYPQLDEVQALKARGQACGRTWQGSLAKYDRNLSMWKTAQCSLLGDLDEFSGTWPSWGMMHNGECWEQMTWVPRTAERESGLWPAPNVPNGGRSVKHVTEWSESGKTAYHKGKKVQVGLESAVKMWPTPQASDNRDRGNLSSGNVKRRRKKGKQIGLSQSVSVESGQLNPTWVEWLMGWPQGWTDLKPLETGKFREWQRQHSMN